jgi:hypothetical protein
MSGCDSEFLEIRSFNEKGTSHTVTQSARNFKKGYNIKKNKGLLPKIETLTCLHWATFCIRARFSARK